jgi:NAD(P)-dependent dehydrogenase (short-subunit alcohol dehydrogenase family)
MAVDLSGRVALVTGASAGLGRRFAAALGEAGASLVLLARRGEALEEAARELRGRGVRVLTAAVDLTDAAAIPAVFDAAERDLGIVDILVNNAGVSDANYATRLSLAEIDRVISVNLRAPFLMATEAARRLITAGKPGRIVNLSSVGAFHYESTSAAALYVATKAGIIRMTEALAIEWARYDVNVNAIAPGMFESEMTDAFLERVGDRASARFPRRRIGKPEFLDSTLLYLVDPASHFVTGTCVTVDDAQLSR